MSAAFDLVVVGSGAGGAAVAWRAVQRGLRVLVLEAGPVFDPALDYRLDRDDWELTRFPEKPGSVGRFSFAPMQALAPEHDGLRSWSHVYGRLNPGDRRKPSGVGYHHVRGVGGSTLHFTGEGHRMNPHAMRMKSDFGVAADWPLDYAALEPYYVEVETLLQTTGPADTGDRWRSAPYPQPPHPVCRASRLLGRGATALGWGWDVNPRSALSQAHDGRPPCNYCGGCNRGCPRGDKSSADLTFLAQARASGRCEIRADCEVVGLVVDGARVVAVEAVRAGTTSRIDTPRLVLAAGAIETPRLLLWHNRRQPGQAVAAGSGQLGRNLMESTGWTSVGIAGEDLASYGGLPADTISWHFNRPDAVPGHVGGFRISAAVHETDMAGPVATARRAVAGWGREHKRKVRETFGRAVAVAAVGEFLPNDGSFVDLDPDRADDHGRPLARIHSFMDAAAIARLSVMQGSCRQLLQAAGVGTLVEEYGSWDFYSASHVFGTCRMGDDPQTSVVDGNLQVHGMENLHVIDTSVFPSSGGGEAPSLTLQALALRAVDRFAKDAAAS